MLTPPVATVNAGEEPEFNPSALARGIYSPVLSPGSAHPCPAQNPGVNGLSGQEQLITGTSIFSCFGGSEVTEK